MRYAVVPAVLIALTACAPQPKATLAQSAAGTAGGVETEARHRARALTELGAGYFELGNMAVALEEVTNALRADPLFGPAHNLAGLIYGRLKEDRLAHEHFQRAIRLDPLDSDANNNYGLFLCERKREAEGIGYFLAAVRNPLYQHADRTYVNAGVCSLRRGDQAAAEGFFRKALELNPNELQALYQLAVIAHRRGNLQEARAHLSRLTQLARPNPETLWLALRVERQLGDRDAEASFAAQLRSNFPDSREARALMAGQYE